MVSVHLRYRKLLLFKPINLISPVSLSVLGALLGEEGLYSESDGVGGAEDARARALNNRIFNKSLGYAP